MTNMKSVFDFPAVVWTRSDGCVALESDLCRNADEQRLVRAIELAECKAYWGTWDDLAMQPDLQVKLPNWPTEFFDIDTSLATFKAVARDFQWGGFAGSELCVLFIDRSADRLSDPVLLEMATELESGKESALLGLSYQYHSNPWTLTYLPFLMSRLDSALRQAYNLPIDLESGPYSAISALDMKLHFLSQS